MKRLREGMNPWLGIFIFAALVIAGASFTYEVHRARSSVSSYLAIWEEDIARSLLLTKDPALLKKVLGQLKEVSSSVRQIEVDPQKSMQCLLQNQTPITLFSLPAGQVRVCYSATELFIQSLLSPIFLLGLFLGLGFLFFGSRRELLNRLKEQKLQSELALTQEISEISRQVAHDIRSPLMALKTLSQLSHEMSSEKQDLLKMAVARIQSVAEDLLIRSRDLKFNRANAPEISTSTSVNLITVIENLMKEYQFAHKDLQFSFVNYSRNALVTGLEEKKFQRVLANILNNAVEACPETAGLIGLSLQEKDQKIILEVMDNGCGIPEEILPKLMQEGVSIGKDKGNGLGLFDAKKTLESAGGELMIRSRLGVGTQIRMVLPLQSEMIRSS